MAETLHCDRCGGESPTDARFCIECGAALGPAATGPTTRLAGIACPACNTPNPENARFCVVCGRGLVAGPPAEPQPAPTRPAARPAPTYAAPRASTRHSYPRVATPPTLLPARPMPPARPHAPQRHDPGAVVFLIGLVVLLASHALWPGILLLAGFSTLVHQAARGRPDKGVRALIWLGGLTLLFATGTLWPGIFILFILNMAMGGWGRSHWWYW